MLRLANVRGMKKGDSAGPDFALEEAAHRRGHSVVTGIDEAGRGPWAGPVVAAAVVLLPQEIPPGLNDSKKLNETDRERLFEHLQTCALLGVGIVDVDYIDEHNILNATMYAMETALENLPVPSDFALIDGNRAPKLNCQLETIIKGDGRSLSIAAASIVAKVTRDRIMTAMATGFPDYGFERHKGYGTRQHQEALARFGPCIHHRKSFAPIRALVETESFRDR